MAGAIFPARGSPVGSARTSSGASTPVRKSTSASLLLALPPMIYTVGIRLKYERAFAAGPVVKLGTSGDYGGGFVFVTAEEARRFLEGEGLAGTHIVMGIEADWNRGTKGEPGEPWRRLVR